MSGWLVYIARLLLGFVSANMSEKLQVFPAAQSAILVKTAVNSFATGGVRSKK